MGLLWCAGEQKVKASLMFECLNPKNESQAMISANDDEWKHFCTIYFEIATIFIMKNALSNTNFTNENP